MKTNEIPERLAAMRQFMEEKNWMHLSSPVPMPT